MNVTPPTSIQSTFRFRSIPAVGSQKSFEKATSTWSAVTVPTAPTNDEGLEVYVRTSHPSDVTLPAQPVIIATLRGLFVISRTPPKPSRRSSAAPMRKSRSSSSKPSR